MKNGKINDKYSEYLNGPDDEIEIDKERELYGKPYTRKDYYRDIRQGKEKISSPEEKENSYRFFFGDEVAKREGAKYKDQHDRIQRWMNDDRQKKLEQLKRWSSEKKRPTALQEEFSKRRMEDSANTEDMEDDEYVKHWNNRYGDLWEKAKSKSALDKSNKQPTRKESVNLGNTESLRRRDNYDPKTDLETKRLGGFVERNQEQQRKNPTDWKEYDRLESIVRERKVPEDQWNDALAKMKSMARVVN